MNKIILICDKKWSENYQNFSKIKYDEVYFLNYEENFVTKKIIEKIKISENDYIIVVNKKYDNHFKIINNLSRNLEKNNIIIYGKNLKRFDFTKIEDDCIIGFHNKGIFKNENFNSGSFIKDLQKYIISRAIESTKFNLKTIDYYNKLKDVIYGENLIKEDKKKNQKNKQYENLSVTNKKILQPEIINDKPKILFVCDVKDWAWWLKSKYIKKYLNDFYDIDIISVIDKPQSINHNNYDLYFTYGYSYVSRLLKAPENRRIAGVTAHRSLDILKKKLSKVAWTHANSILLYNDLKTIHSNNFYVPNGVDENLFFPQKEILSNDNIIFGHVGKKSPNKGQETYLEPAVKQTRVQYFSHYNNYKTKIPHNEMVDVHQNYDIFLCSSYEDGTPCPALEAAACGRPIISNKIGNMPELIENYKTGILLERRDVDLYIDAIKWCQNNPDKVKEMGKNIRKKIEEEWTWELMARNYLYMFDSILGIKRELSFYSNPAQFHIKED